MKTNFKISQFSRILLRSNFAIKVKIWKWLKLLNSFPFIKKTLVNHAYLRIWSFRLTFTILQWMKKNSKFIEFSRFLLRSQYAIQVKIWKWLKLLKSFPFIKKTLSNKVYIRVWSFSLTFTVLQWKKTNFKISQFSRFLQRNQLAIRVQNLKMTKASSFCSIHQENTCKSSLNSNFIIFTDFHSFTVKEDKLQN